LILFYLWVFGFVFCDYWLYNQNKCYYIVFILFGDIWNCELGFEQDHVNLMQERIELSLLKYRCKLLCKLWLYDVKWSIWNNGVLEAHLVMHELGFLGWCLIQVNFWVKYVHLDQIMWFVMLEWLLKLIWMFAEFY